jgi:S-DNA-T family DNA segregation ATPase FtsK/SpoIIIE
LSVNDRESRLHCQQLALPRRARAYLVTDEMVAETSARHSRIPRQLDEISRNAMLNAPAWPATEFRPENEAADDIPAGIPGQGQPAPEEILWSALSAAPSEGVSLFHPGYAVWISRV